MFGLQPTSLKKSNNNNKKELYEQSLKSFRAIFYYL